MNLKLATAVCLLAAIVFGAACGGGADSTPPTATTQSVTVSRGNDVVGQFATAAEAFAKASDVAGFKVLEAHELPTGYTIDSINILDSPAANASSPRQALVGVRGESGGLLITELNARATLGNDATRLTSQQPGEFYVSGTDATKTYFRLTDDRTYALGSPNRALHDAEAITVLASLR